MKEKIKSRFPKFFGALKWAYYRLRRLNPFISSRYMYLHGGKYLDLRHFKSVELKPNLFIIGAAKSGTTSLHNYLDQHPDIHMAKPNKEAHYLLDFEHARNIYRNAHMPIRNKQDILKNHVLKSYKGEKIIGESSTLYTRWNISEEQGVIKAVKNYKPKPKLIYIIRHPLERIVSNHLQWVRERGTKISLDETVNRREASTITSFYGSQLERYLRVIPYSRINVIFYEDMLENPDGLMKQLTEFLNVDKQFNFETDLAYNTRGANSNYSASHLKLQKATYKSLVTRIKKDINLLEDLTGLKTQWEFNEQEWTI